MSIRSIGQRAAGHDRVIVIATLFLVTIGLAMVYNASSAIGPAKRHPLPETYFLERQALSALLGVFAFLAARYFPYRYYEKLAYPMLLVAFIFLGLVMVPGIGREAGGATRWLNLGPFSFQPSELGKFCLIIYLAYSMAKKGKSMAVFWIGVLPHVFMAGAMAFMFMVQPDYGSAVLLCGISGLMLFMGGVRVRYLILLGLIGVALVLIYLFSEEYRMVRVYAFLWPDRYPSGSAYQIKHSLFAFGSGGLWGSGLGAGIQKLFYLPEPHTDFIFSVLGEETGLAGVLTVVLLYSLLAWRGFAVARGVPDAFGAYLAAGLVLCIIIPAVTNIGVTMRLLPTKGLSLPFISYGGTSLVMNLMSAGVLCNIAATNAQALAPRRNVKVTRKEQCPGNA
jgi:cell division protein FtsW